MVNAGIKDEFEAYVRNADLEDFIQDKCPQYYQLTDSFIRGLNIHLHIILRVSCLIFMINLIPWT